MPNFQLSLSGYRL